VIYLQESFRMKLRSDFGVIQGMNANNQNLVPRSNFAPAGVVLAVLAVASLFAAPTALADVRVGVSLGFELPHGYAEVRVGREHYYEHRGVFYRHGPHGLVVVSAPRGAILRSLPPHCTRIYVGTTVYYRYGEVYYQPVRNGYAVVDQPVVESLPPVRPTEVYQSVWVGPTAYLFKDGQFFAKTPDGLTWIQAPVGAITRNLPPDAQSVWYQGVEYFDCDDVYFRKTPDGYQVVTVPWKK
jgi:hypothetical protein